MNTQRIKKLQKETGYDEMQRLIDSGQAWLMEGYVGRQAMNALEIGACMLPTERCTYYYGGTVPSRYDVKPGTKGSYKRCADFWNAFEVRGYVFDHQTYI